jgi:hypothetical protein
MEASTGIEPVYTDLQKLYNKKTLIFTRCYGYK